MRGGGAFLGTGAAWSGVSASESFRSHAAAVAACLASPTGRLISLEGMPMQAAAPKMMPAFAIATKATKTRLPSYLMGPLLPPAR